MSVFCTLNSTEYWDQLCNVSKQTICDSVAAVNVESDTACYIKKALSIGDVTSLVMQQPQVFLVIPPPNISLLSFTSEDYKERVDSLTSELNNLYKVYKKHRHNLKLIPLSALTKSYNADTSFIPELQQIIDETQSTTNVYSVISHSLFAQNEALSKAYKKIQSCFAVKSEDAILLPDINSLKTSLIHDEINKQEVLDENTRLISQNQKLLLSLEVKFSELAALSNLRERDNELKVNLDAKVSELSSSLALSEDKCREEKKYSSELNKELVRLKASLTDEVSALTNQLLIVQKEFKATSDAFSEFVLKSKKEATIAEKTKNREIKSLESKLEKKVQVEHALRSELAELRAIKSSKLWKVSSKVEKLSHTVDKNGAKRKKLSQDMSLLYTSELFDADWYLETYADVKEEGMDPAEHYLLYGAKEGRKPSAKFDGNWYLQANPDVAKENSNPLVHYIKFGRDEKRPISPVMITFNKK